MSVFFSVYMLMYTLVYTLWRPLCHLSSLPPVFRVRSLGVIDLGLPLRYKPRTEAHTSLYRCIVDETEIGRFTNSNLVRGW